MAEDDDPAPSTQEHRTLKYSLLGPSLTKAGQDDVDQKKVSCSAEDRFRRALI
jgi:DNA polymerase kappa